MQPDDGPRHRASGCRARCTTVGVFRDERPERVVEIVSTRRAARRCSCTGASRCRRCSGSASGCAFVIQALRRRRSRARAPRPTARPTSILVDSPDPGSGTVFDWALAEGAPSGVRLLLAGGLTPRTSARRSGACGRGASTCRPASRPPPGRKDPRKLRAVHRARRARPRRRRSLDRRDRPATSRRRRRGRHAPVRLAARRRTTRTPARRRRSDDCRTVRSVGCQSRRAATPVHLEPPGPEPVGLGRFGEFGGRFVPETLVPALERARGRVPRARGPTDDVPRRVRRRCCATTPAGRRRSPSATGSRSGSACGCCSSARTSPTPARTRSTTCSARRCSPGAWASSGSIAETGAGQHGVATATAAALFGLECIVYMGAVDVERQALNVFRMKLLGAEVVPGRRRAAAR